MEIIHAPVSLMVTNQTQTCVQDLLAITIIRVTMMA